MSDSMGLPEQPEGKEIRQEGGNVDSKEEIRMSLSQLELLFEYLPDGVMLEISWEDAYEE